MSTLSQEQQMGKGSPGTDALRVELLENAKYFKTSWVNLGQALYPVWKDKLFHAWGYEKFEHYTDKELGIKNTTALKLLKTYFFLEQNEPDYLEKGFSKERKAIQVPGCDEVNVLRLARNRRELNRDDYTKLKSHIFDKGKNASAVRRELTALMKERKQVDPDEERRMRNEAAIRRLVNAISSFSKDMDALKLSPAELVEEAKKLKEKLEKEVS